MRNRFILRNRSSFPIWLRPIGRAVRVFLTNRLDTGITLTDAARFSLMSSLISSNYPDTAGCPRLGNIAIFPIPAGKEAYWQPAFGSYQLHVGAGSYKRHHGGIVHASPFSQSRRKHPHQ